MEKALSWSSIKPDDTKALQVYTLFLRGCCNAMEDVSYMHELDMPSNMLAIIKKMPYRLRDKWRTVACDLQEKNKQRATFKDMVNFLERQVKIITDPLFGDIKDATSQNGRRSKTQPHSRIKGNIFATTDSCRKENWRNKGKLTCGQELFVLWRWTCLREVSTVGTKGHIVRKSRS